MEFPHLGQHCSESTCNRLDFLPVKCDACDKVFCGNHMFYERHNCEAAYKKDVQVPICPLCNKPVPIKRGELPDVNVGEHIDRDCQSDPAKKKRIYVNKCSHKGCRTKEIVKVTCGSCYLNYCLRHRHPQDHDCQSKKPADQKLRPSVNAINDNFFPKRSNLTERTMVSTVQGTMDEDEALAKALHLSLCNNFESSSQLQQATNNQDLDEDMNLARALAESEREYRRQQESQNKKEKCVVV